MKRLGLYAVIGVMLIGMMSGLVNPEKSFAQAPTAGQQYQTRGTDLFDKQIAELEAKKNNLGGVPPTTITVVESLITVITVAKAEFITNFNPDSPDPKIEYSRAVSLAIQYIKQQQGLNRSTLMSPYANNVIAVFVNQLNVSASQDILYQNLTPEQKALLNADNNKRYSSAVSTATAATTPNPSKCSLLDGNLIGCIDSLLAWIIKHTLLEIAGFLVWLSASMLNLSIQVGILNFSQWAPDTLYPIWIIVRQIISLFIVFAGLYLGFMYILGRDDKFEKYIPWVIIFALFVNFSYPLTRALVDVSNVVSLNIYSSTMGSEALTGSIGNLVTSEQTPGAIIRNRLGLQSLVFSTVNDEKAASISGSINSVPGALMAVIFTLYAAFILFMLTALMIIRTAILVFLTIASPLLFVDSVIPKLGDEAVKLRKMFFEQLIVAPVFMIMLALTLKFLEVFQSGPLKSSEGTVQVFFNLIIMLIMLHIMYKVTKSVAGSAGQMATNFMGKVGGFGLGVASGGAGFLARGTLGRGAAALRDSKWVTNNQDSFLGRRAYSMTNSLANSTYDARNSGMIAGGMSKAGMGMGAGGQKGYDALLKEKIDDRTARYGRIKTENKDGTIDQYGAESKRRFYSNAGGVFTNKNAVRESLLKKDQEQANKENKRGTNTSTFGKQNSVTGQQSQSGQNQTATPATQQQTPSTQPNSNTQGIPSQQPTQTQAPSSVSSVDYDIPTYQRKNIDIEGVNTAQTNNTPAPAFDLNKQDFRLFAEQRRVEKQKVSMERARTEMGGGNKSPSSSNAPYTNTASTSNNPPQTRSPAEIAKNEDKENLFTGKKLQQEVTDNVNTHSQAEKETVSDESKTRDKVVAPSATEKIIPGPLSKNPSEDSSALINNNSNPHNPGRETGTSMIQNTTSGNPHVFSPVSQKTRDAFNQNSSNKEREDLEKR